MKSKPIEHKYIIHYEGIVDEATLVFFIRKISDNKNLPNRIKSNLKFILIELITNMISHSVSDAYGTISVENDEEGIVIVTSNYSNTQQFELIQSNLNQIKKVKNVKGHYNDQLKMVSFEKSVNLGLIEIYNRCNGRMKVSAKEEASQLLITFKLKINDTN